MRMPVHNHVALKSARRALRNKGTPAEAALWSLLKGKQLEGRKFRRQYSVGGYVLDFYCPAESLAVELDGAAHFTSLGHDQDAARTQYLSAAGIQVIRFENHMVFEYPGVVLDGIRSHFKLR